MTEREMHVHRELVLHTVGDAVRWCGRVGVTREEVVHDVREAAERSESRARVLRDYERRLSTAGTGSQQPGGMGWWRPEEAGQ